MNVTLTKHRRLGTVPYNASRKYHLERTTDIHIYATSDHTSGFKPVVKIIHGSPRVPFQLNVTTQNKSISNWDDLRANNGRPLNLTFDAEKKKKKKNELLERCNKFLVTAAYAYFVFREKKNRDTKYARESRNIKK